MFAHKDLLRRNVVAAVRTALRDRRTVLGGFRTIIKLQGKPLRVMTVHQLIKTFYIPLLFRPLSFIRSAAGLDLFPTKC
jgi:hypothetical protein